MTGDDPEFLYTYVRDGARGYRSYLGWQRPFAFWIYELLTPIFKTNMPLYQAANLLLRWLSAWLLFANLRRLMPDKEAPLWVSILFTVYPGFLQQPIAMAYLQHFTSLPLLLGSLLVMQLALETDSRTRFYVLSALSVLMMAGMFPIEYFVGWELLRPLVIWLKLPEEEKFIQKTVRTFTLWLPYLLVLAGYFYWRLIAAASKKYPTVLLGALRADPLDGFGQLARRAGHDLWLASVQVFGNFTQLEFKGNFALVSLFFGLAVGLALLILLLARKNAEKINRTFSLGLIGIGIFAMLAGGPVIWFADIPMTLDYPWDRTTLVLLLGVCLAWTGVLYLLPRAVRAGLLSLVVGLSVAFHLQNINTYFKEWEQMRQIFWQLSWRAPDIQPGTMLLMDGLPTRYYPSNSYTSLLNWTYDPGVSDSEQKYKIIEISQRIGNVLPSLEPDVPVVHGTFKGSTSRSITIFKTSSGCLHVLRPQDRYYRDIAPTINEAMRLTDESLIDARADNPVLPPALMFPEPDHGWCYFLQKAELARQEGQWDQAAAVAAEVEGLSLTPPVPFDWAVFAEGYARLGEFERAVEYISRIAAQPPGYDNALCFFISRLAGEIAGAEVLVTDAARENCGF